MSQGADSSGLPANRLASTGAAALRFAARPGVAFAGAALFATVFLLSQIGVSGVWDPVEFRSAEASRRIAVHAFGATSLALPDDPPTIPTLSDLGMGGFPFTSMALAYRLFGWHDWVGRLALGVWAVLGALALFTLLARTIDRRTGFYGLVVLTTSPLYFMQSRTMVGDIVTLASFSIAMTGLGLGLVERTLRARILALIVGVIGLVAGYLTRGLLLGVAPPLLTIGVAGLLLARGRALPKAMLAAPIAMVVIGVGAAIQWLRLAVPIANTDHALVRAVGATLVDPTPRDSTFERIFRQLGHALFPWSALLPFAIASITRSPPSARTDVSGDTPTLGTPHPDREEHGRLFVLLGAIFGTLATTVVTPYAGVVPCVGVTALAAAIAIALRDLERDGESHNDRSTSGSVTSGADPQASRSDADTFPAGAPWHGWHAETRSTRGRALAASTIALGVILFFDVRRDPVRMLATFANDVAFPSTFVDESASRLKIVAAVFLALVALAWFDRPRLELGAPPSAERGFRASARRYLRAKWTNLQSILGELGDAYGGNLVFVFVILEATFVGLAAMLFIGSKAGWESINNFPRWLSGILLNLWWGVPIGLTLAIIAWVGIRDGAVLATRKLGVTRATLALAGGLVAGSLLSFGYYPSLAQKLSPKGVFATFNARRTPSDEIALLGVSPRAASFYLEGETRAFDEPVAAYPWLTEPLDAGEDGVVPRRWLVLRARDLPKLNARHRADFGTNLPIADARSGVILLASTFVEGTNQNPFMDVFLDRAPRIQHPVTARFGDQIDALGWDITGDDDAPLESVVAGRAYKMHFYYKTIQPVSGTWQSFIHIDGQGRRHNGDHPTLDGRYPMSLWHEGDIVRDTYELELGPQFQAGEYAVYYGFFNSGARMNVSGDARENRVNGGVLPRSLNVGFEGAGAARPSSVDAPSESGYGLTMSSGESDRPPSSDDRRRSGRYPVMWAVDCATEDTFLYASITNISAMGIFVRTIDPLPVGTEITLRFAAQATDAGSPDPFVLRGLVQWINRPLNDSPNPGMGVRFIELTPDERERIVEVIHTIAYLREDPMLSAKPE